MNKGLPVAVAILLWSAVGYPGVAADELDREIEQVKKEIQRVTTQRNEENALAAREQKDFKAYKKKVAVKKKRLSLHTDSLKVEVNALKRTNDSLVVTLQSVEQKISEEDLRKKYVGVALAQAVDLVTTALMQLPPLIVEQYRSSLEHLYRELKAGSIENSEGLFRLMRIVQDVRVLSQDIQVVEGSSPVPQLRGTVYRLRIGAFFEAVVDRQGTTAFLWCDSTDQQVEARYCAVTDPVVAGAILKAITIREGKSIPELVPLPLSSVEMQGGAE